MMLWKGLKELKSSRNPIELAEQITYDTHIGTNVKH